MLKLFVLSILVGGFIAGNSVDASADPWTIPTDVAQPMGIGWPETRADCTCVWLWDTNTP